MIDCAHWIPIIHEQEKAEHAEAKRKHARQVYAMQDTINQIRSIINCLDGELAGQEPSLMTQNQQRIALGKIGLRVPHGWPFGGVL